MKNEIIDIGGQNWLVKESVSKDEALNAIAHARCTGSLGSKHVENCNGIERVLADVSRSN